MDLSFRSIKFAIHHCHISHTMPFCDFVDRGSLTPVPWYTSNYPVWKRYPHQLIPNWSSVNLIRFEYFYISNECSCAHLTQGGKTFGGEFLKYADCSFSFSWLIRVILSVIKTFLTKFELKHSKWRTLHEQIRASEISGIYQWMRPVMQEGFPYRMITVQWNLSVTTTSKIKFIICDLFSDVF